MQEMASVQVETQAHIPAYADWLDAQDLRGVYRYEETALKVLQHGYDATRWNLKTPAYLVGLDAIFDVYPDARMVWTHRDPADVVVSVSSLNAALHQVMTKDVDRVAVAHHWLERLGGMVDRAMAYLDEHPDAPITHLHYRDLLDDPVGSVERVYADLGFELDDDAKAAVVAATEHHRQDKHGRHRYQGEDFDLTPGDDPGALRRLLREVRHVKFGITMFPTDKSIGSIELARACEERGFASLYVPGAHPHPRQPGDAGAGGRAAGRGVLPLARPVRRARRGRRGHRRRLRFGTGIALVAQRDPIVLAKEVASLDFVSGGRFVFGIGFGWNVEELADHGVAFGDRRAVVQERVEAMKAIWTQDEAGYSGRARRLPADLLLAEAGPAAAPADPHRRRWRPEAVRGHRRLRRRLDPDRWWRRQQADAGCCTRPWRRSGRDPDRLTIVPFGVLPDPGKLAYYEESGFQEVVFRVPPAPEAKVLEILDRLAADFL